MNYRHAYHAGNFADCFKHALLITLLDLLSRKPTPYFVLDTHAGAGRYDLDTEPARRTKESDAGIRRLLADRPASLRRYLDVVEALGLYPGSPVLISAMLRANDRLACCELHPDEANLLKQVFRLNRQTEVHFRSGWEALRALLPPKEKRGLVFIDPPFEDREEFTSLAASLRMAHSRFGHGIFAAWYPIKQRAAVSNFLAVMKASSIRDIIAIELHLRALTSADRFNGCGLLVINPPYRFEEQAGLITAAVLDSVGTRERGAAIAVVRLTDE